MGITLPFFFSIALSSCLFGKRAVANVAQLQFLGLASHVNDPVSIGKFAAMKSPNGAFCTCNGINNLMIHPSKPWLTVKYGAGKITSSKKSPLTRSQFLVLSKSALAMGISSSSVQDMEQKDDKEASGPAFSSTATSSYSSSPTNSNFPWINWFPLAFESFLFRDRPSRHYLLGSPVVVWCVQNNSSDGNGGNARNKSNSILWHAMLDICPHRLAPLSEGRIIPAGPRQGCIECPYHGWTFEGGSGRCRHIPQQQNSKESSSSSLQSAASSGVALPTAIRQGILWVHTVPLFQNHDYSVNNTSSPNTSYIDPFLVSHLDEPGVAYTDYFRDLPMDWSTLVENVIDPSHLPFTHHRTIGKRPPDEEKINNEKNVKGSSKSPATPLRLTAPVSPTGIYADRLTSNPGTVEYIAPHLVISCTDRRSTLDSFRDWNVAYAIPTLPGRCRLLVRVAFETDRMKNGPMKWAFETAFGIVPSWLLHLRNHVILEDDNIFLHYQMHHYEGASLSDSAKTDYLNQNDSQQQRSLKKERSVKEKVSFLPTSSDITVSAFHRWLHQYGATDQMWTRYTPPGAFVDKQRILSKKELLDRGMTHTDQCTACDGARNFLKGTLEPGLRTALGICCTVQVSILSGIATETTKTTIPMNSVVLPITFAGFIVYFLREAVLQTLRSMENGVYPPPRNQ